MAPKPEKEPEEDQVAPVFESLSLCILSLVVESRILQIIVSFGAFDESVPLVPERNAKNNPKQPIHAITSSRHYSRSRWTFTTYCASNRSSKVFIICLSCLRVTQHAIRLLYQHELFLGCARLVQIRMPLFRFLQSKKGMLRQNVG